MVKYVTSQELEKLLGGRKARRVRFLGLLVRTLQNAGARFRGGFG